MWANYLRTILLFAFFLLSLWAIMEQKAFLSVLDGYERSGLIMQIRTMAHDLHKSVNQTYGGHLPYGYHLDMVATAVSSYGHLVCASEQDVLPMLFGAFFHDSIEDARVTYNDVLKVARGVMSNEQALMATEIVYALTNDKGRNRAERAGEKYYAGIRSTPYAPFVKLCDRMANVVFSCSDSDEYNDRMKEIYKKEMPHFLKAISPLAADEEHAADARFSVPSELVEKMMGCLSDEPLSEDELKTAWP